MKYIAGAMIVLCLSGCVGLPPAAYIAIGAGFGYAASVNNLAIEAVEVWDKRNPQQKPEQGK